MDAPSILLLTDGDVFAGTERHMLELACGLQARGVRTSIGCPVPSALHEKAPDLGVEIVRIQKGGTVDREAIGTLRGLLRSGAIDLVHSHNGRSALSAAVAVRLAGRGASVATQHFLEPGRLERRGAAAFLSGLAHRWVNGRTAQFLAISEAVRDGMLQRAEATADRISVVTNGISDPRLAKLTPPEQVRRELGLEPGVPLVVCAARLEREKDVGSLIAAMARVRTAIPSVRCVVAGEGALENALRAQIREAHLDETVRLLGFRSDALSLIAAGDVFVLPSLAEPFGLVLLEAMGLGKAVVATDAGGPKEIVVNEATGLLVPPANPEALAVALRRLLENPADRERMAAAGRKRFEENFTVERMAAETLAVYRRALARAPGEPVLTRRREVLT